MRGRNGKPVAQARVYFTAAPGPFPDVAALSDKQGAFILPAATAPGVYRVACSADGYRTAEVEVTVKAGERASVELSLTPER